MPTITQTPVKAYAHCLNARCPGYEQVEVDAVQETAAYTFGEMGGDGVFAQFVQNSIVEHKFADPEKAPCPGCGSPREVSREPREVYAAQSGHDPMGLLAMDPFDAQKQAQVAQASAAFVKSDEEIEVEIRERLRREQIEARIRAEMAGD